MADAIAFLPNLQESIMDELRTTEGMLFRDESAKKLFIDVKSLVLESLSSAWNTFKGAVYETVLDRYVAWDASVASEELHRSETNYKDVSERLQSVTVLYAKMLYAKPHGGGNDSMVINIRKPKLEALLRGMFTRMARLKFVRTGAFFDLDPLRQDFVVRDVFRQALSNDCISVIESQVRAAPEVHIIATQVEPPVRSSTEQQQAAHELHVEHSELQAVAAEAAEAAHGLADAAEQLPQSPQRTVLGDFSKLLEGDVYPDDSISAVMTRMQGEPAHTAPPMLEALPEVSDEKHSAATARTTHTRASVFRMPTGVKRVVLSRAPTED